MLDLIQLLRSHRFPVSGAALAGGLGISLRTLYRDIATLRAQGADIEGEAGVGFLLRPGFMLPPLMFTDDEIEALVLGARFVARRADTGLSSAASSLLAKIGAVLPKDMRSGIESASLLVAPASDNTIVTIDLAVLRRAIRLQRKICIDYRDGDGTGTQRTIWPIALGYFETARVLAAWCESRTGFRHFRCDRIGALEILPTPYPRSRDVLLRQWREIERLRQRSPC